MEREISETYRFNYNEYDEKGRSIKDGLPFREHVRDFERDFHARHSCEYALNFYSNSRTMMLLERSCDAAPFLMYGMELTQGQAFDAEQDPYFNHRMNKNNANIMVYGIDSAFMTEFDEYGYPIINESKAIYPLTLLIDNTMRDNEVRLAVPTLGGGDETEEVNIDVPKPEYA